MAAARVKIATLRIPLGGNHRPRDFGADPPDIGSCFKAGWWDMLPPIHPHYVFFPFFIMRVSAGPTWARCLNEKPVAVDGTPSSDEASFT